MPLRSAYHIRRSGYGFAERDICKRVFPVIGCTGPISCAYASAAAAEQLAAPVRKITLIVDPGTYKNGAAVTIPNSGGQKGNVIAAPLICDGAKPGCSMKIVSGADTVIRSAFMALANYGLSTDEGVPGRSVEESMLNLGKVSFEGMDLVDPTVVHIIQSKAGRSGRARTTKIVAAHRP